MYILLIAKFSSINDLKNAYWLHVSENINWKQRVNHYNGFDILHHFSTSFDRFASADIEVARADPGSLIKNSVFSVEAYWRVLWLRDGDTSKFDREVEATFKKLAKGSRAPDADKVSMDRIMLVCQCENCIDMAYGDSEGFGHPGMMGLWDLHSREAMSRAKMQLHEWESRREFLPLVCILVHK